ncbi:MAG: hypothetical protein AAGD25_19825 [Cyanobacteria bacterium P01_F01_bin.150]
MSQPIIIPTTGGYQLSPEDVKGYQILVNYRPKSPTIIGLKGLIIVGGKLGRGAPQLPVGSVPA